MHQLFEISAAVHKNPWLAKGTAAEFAPEPALYGVFDPFIGTATRDFGFQVTLTVTAD